LTKFFWDTVYNFNRHGLSLILGLLTSRFLTRGLGVDARGVSSLAILLPALATTFANLGIASATVYLVDHKEIPEEDIFSTKEVARIYYWERIAKDISSVENPGYLPLAGGAITGRHSKCFASLALQVAD